MKLTFKHTRFACYIAYISQAVTTTFLPLLFVRLTTEFGFSLAQLTILITITFFSEIFIDALCPLFINKIGYRTGMIIANICSVAGTAGLAVFPFLFKNPYIGFIICDVLYAIGGGFDEVLISPIVEACPTNNKAGAMGLLHSFYCWGCAAIVLFSTLFFQIFGIESWRFDLCRCKRAFHEPVGICLRGNGAWRFKNSGRSSGPLCLCCAYGHFPSNLFQNQR